MFFGDHPHPPLSKGLDDQGPPPLISRSGSGTVVCFNVTLLVYCMAAQMMIANLSNNNNTLITLNDDGDNNRT